MFQLKWLWQNMKGFRGRYLFALCSTVILSSTAMVQNLIISNIMDRVFQPVADGLPITEALTTTLIWLVILLIGNAAIRNCYLYGTVICYETCSQNMIYRLRNHLYRNMQTQDAVFYSKNRTGDLMNRLTGDMDMIRHALAWVFRMLIDCVFLFLSTAVCFLIKDWLFALCLLAVTPFIMLLTWKFSRKVGPLYVDLRERMSQMNTAAQENISGNRVVKAFAQEDREIERFDEKNKDYREANLKASLLWLKFSPYVDALSQSLSIAVLLVGGIFLISGRISVGTFALFNGLCWALTNPMQSLGMILNDLQRFFASANKIIELYYARSTIQSRHDAITPKTRLQGGISFRDVSLKLNGTQVLKNINLDIAPGETVAIMGPTGCGKTSLVHLIPRFCDPNQGQVLIDGIPVNHLDLQSVRSAIGLASQDVFLFSDTVDGNIAYGDSELPQEEVARYAKAACVDFIHKLSQGYDTIIGERGTGLSGGQKQRIALARALAVKPSILILDDTTSAVDMETEHIIQEELKNLPYTCTKVIVAQRISTSKRADKIVIMDKGEIVQVGTHDQLAAVDGYYRDVFLLQTGDA